MEADATAVVAGTATHADMQKQRVAAAIISLTEVTRATADSMAVRKAIPKQHGTDGNTTATAGQIMLNNATVADMALAAGLAILLRKSCLFPGRLFLPVGGPFTPDGARARIPESPRSLKSGIYPRIFSVYRRGQRFMPNLHLYRKPSSS